MTRYYPGDNIVKTFKVYNSSHVLVAPSAITFQYKMGRWGEWIDVTPATSVTGIYTATVTLAYGGPFYWRWKATTPNDALEGMDLVECSEFDTTGQGYLYDYGFGWGGYW
jgi:hypothetical protein